MMCIQWNSYHLGLRCASLRRRCAALMHTADAHPPIDLTQQYLRTTEVRHLPISPPMHLTSHLLLVSPPTLLTNHPSSSQVYVVHDADGLFKLAKEWGLKTGNLRQLIGTNKNSSASCKKLAERRLSANKPSVEKAGWRRLDSVSWIERCEWEELPTIQPMPFCGKNGDEFMNPFSELFNDPALNGARLIDPALDDPHPHPHP